MDGSSGQRDGWRRTSLGWVWVEATAPLALAGVDRGWERDVHAALDRSREAREATTPTLRGVR